MAENKASPDQGGKEAEIEQETDQTPEAEIEPTQQEQVDELQDKLLRLHAEMDNLRKRSAREIADARKFAIERFATSLLDVVDNLERALAVEEGNEKGLRDGVKLTLDSWHTLMERFEMERFDAVGEAFDAHVAGYTLHGRLIRPAKVLISAGNG